MQSEQHRRIWHFVFNGIADSGLGRGGGGGGGGAIEEYLQFAI